MTEILREPFGNTNAWTIANGPALNDGRVGSALELTGTTPKATYVIPAASESDTITVGFAYRTPVLQAGGNGLVQFLSDTQARTHTTLDVSATGALRMTRLGSTIANSAAGVIVVNTWQYIECQIKLGDAPDGAVTVRVNGTPVITATGLDTKNAGTKTVYDGIQLGPVNGSSGGTNFYDDLYLKTGAGETFNGDITVPFGGVVLREPFEVSPAGQPGWSVASPTIVAGRTNNAIQLSGSVQSISYVMTPTEGAGTMIVGVAFKLSTLVNGSDILNLYGDAAIIHTQLLVTTTGAVAITRGNTVLATTAAGLVAVDTWNYFEIKVKLHDTAGAYEVRMNGTLILGPVTGVDTRNAGTKPFYDMVRLWMDQGTVVGTWDDFYVINQAEATFLGPQSITEARLARHSARVGLQSPGGGPDIYRLIRQTVRVAIAPAPAAAKVWTGSAFVDAPTKAWTGSAFVDAVGVKTWNGSAFV